MFESKKIDVDLARALFASVHMGATIPPKYKKQVDQLLSQLPSQQQIARKVVALCGEPTDVAGLELIAEACTWSGADYRPLAIFWIKQLLNAAGDFSHLMPKRNDTIRRMIWSNWYQLLGKAYEGEYDFPQAYSAYSQAIEICGSFGCCYSMSALLIKLGRFDEAVQVMKSARTYELQDLHLHEHDNERHLSMYRENETARKAEMLKHIDMRIAEIRDKQKSGYVYRPRKKKEINQ